MCKSKLSPEVKKYIEEQYIHDIAITLGVGLFEANAYPMTVEQIKALKQRLVNRIKEITDRRDEFIEIMQPYQSKI